MVFTDIMQSHAFFPQSRSSVFVMPSQAPGGLDDKSVLPCHWQISPRCPDQLPMQNILKHANKTFVCSALALADKHFQCRGMQMRSWQLYHTLYRVHPSLILLQTHWVYLQPPHCSISSHRRPSEASGRLKMSLPVSTEFIENPSLIQGFSTSVP